MKLIQHHLPGLAYKIAREKNLQASFSSVRTRLPLTRMCPLPPHAPQAAVKTETVEIRRKALKTHLGTLGVSGRGL